jgi:hypothetical protein
MHELKPDVPEAKSLSPMASIYDLLRVVVRDGLILWLREFLLEE